MSLLHEPAQTPIRLHGALVLVVTGIRNLECAYGGQERLGAPTEWRLPALQGGDELPLVNEIDVATKRRAHPGVTAQAKALVRLGMYGQRYLAGGLNPIDRGDVTFGE